MSKHLEVKLRGDRNEKVMLTMTVRDAYGRLRPHETRQFTVGRAEFEAALNQATVEIPWKGLL